MKGVSNYAVFQKQMKPIIRIHFEERFINIWNISYDEKYYLPNDFPLHLCKSPLLKFWHIWDSYLIFL